MLLAKTYLNIYNYVDFCDDRPFWWGNDPCNNYFEHGDGNQGLTDRRHLLRENTILYCGENTILYCGDDIVQILSGSWLTQYG